MTTRYCPNCKSTDIITQVPHGHQPRRELEKDKAFVCVACGLSIAWPAVQRITNIERTSRVFKETDDGVRAFYQGYDIDGNEVALLTGAEFYQWLQNGYVERAGEGE